MVAILAAGSWYLIRRRRLIMKQKRIEKEESTMTIAQKEISRQQRRDKMRDQGNKDDAAMKNTTEGLGWGLAAVGG
jgi:Flp pilus assembly protein TadB